MKDLRRESLITFAGGLDLKTPPLKLPPGAMIDCRNFECDAIGGYTLSKGYERFDGRPSPTETEDSATRSTRRDAIEQVPGAGPIRGTWIYKGEVYAFRDNAAQDACAMFKATPGGWSEISTGVTLNPGGRYQFLNYNFQAGADEQVMIGTDGENKAFVWNGSTFTQIDVTGETDFPLFCAVLNNYLFLGYRKGYLYYSAVGEPANFDPVDNAGGLGTGDFMTGLQVNVGGTLVVMMENSIAVLYGNGPSDWQNKDLRLQEDQIGVRPYSTASYGTLYYLDDRGITNLQATQAYGNFYSATVSAKVERYINARKDDFSFAYPVPSKNQLRWVFLPASDAQRSEVLTMTFIGNEIAGFSAQVYNHRMVCAAQGEDANGRELIVCGDESGWIFQMETGTSIDGNKMLARYQTAFNGFGTPMQRKHFLNAIFQVSVAQSDLSINVKPVFDYGSPLVGSHRVGEISVLQPGGAWNEVNWNEFRWSSQIIQEGRADIAGTGRNMGWVVSVISDSTEPFTVSECMVYMTLRRWQR